MINIKGERVVLRAVEPEDIDQLYQWENNTDLWHVSGTVTPFSRHILAQFIEPQQQDIFTSRQMRLMICEANSGAAVGTLDLFEFDPLNQRAGVGIMIGDSYRKCGYGSDALRTFEQYAQQTLRLHQIWCNVEDGNAASIALFSSLGYREVGRKVAWNFSPEGFRDEVMMQKIL